MKKLIYIASAFILLTTLFSCQKEEVKPESKPVKEERSSNENFEASYTQEDVNSILADAGVEMPKAADPVIIVIPGKWDGNIDSDEIGCDDGNVCAIEIIVLPPLTTVGNGNNGSGDNDSIGADRTILLPRERGKPEKIKGRITGPPTEVLDNQGNVTKRKYPYERFE